MLGWDFQRRATAKDAAGRPRVPFEEAVECHDLFGSAYILPWPLLDKRIAGMVEAATRPLEPTEDELRTAVQAVTEAVTAEAARAVARTHPDAAVEVEYALWGTPALRYDGPDQDQAALYERGIPADALLEGALAHTPRGRHRRRKHPHPEDGTRRRGSGALRTRRGEGEHPPRPHPDRGGRAHRGGDRPVPCPAGSQLPLQRQKPPATDSHRHPRRHGPSRAPRGPEPYRRPRLRTLTLGGCWDRRASRGPWLVLANRVT